MKNFYILYGTNKSLIKNELDKIINKININDVIYYDLNINNLLDIIDDAATISMFSTKKVIVVENSYFLTSSKNIENIEELDKYLKNYNSDTYMIFISNTETIDSRKKIVKLIKEIGEVKELNKIDDNYLHDYINNYLKEYNYKMEDVKYFLSKTGKDLNNIKNELDKLLSYKIDDNLITNSDIDKIIVNVLESEIFILTDAIITRDVKLSLDLLQEFLNNNYEEMQIIMLLASQFRFLFQVKRLLNKNKSESEIAKILEVNPYRVKFTKKKLYNYSEKLLLEYISKIAKIDHDIKLGIMNKRIALELFIIEP